MSPKSPRPPDRATTTAPATGGDAAPATDAPLDDRKAAILKAVVAEYIDSAQPVGSAHITGTPGVEVSSATVRSEMAALERDGYLVQPHTSAGRIPTDKGYRFFVDHLGRPGTLGPDQRQQVRQFFGHVHGEVEELLGRTSGFLSDLTHYAAVVVGPTHDTATVRSVQLVDLGSNVGLLVVVLSDGAVEKRTIELADDADDDALTAAAARLTSHLRDRMLAEASGISSTGDSPADVLVRRGAQAVAQLSSPDEPEHVFVGGSSRMA
ncbi:MAG: heat-inducible transcriptional repressor HrcA, partial [Acidimicrobiales bacterium]